VWSASKARVYFVSGARLGTSATRLYAAAALLLIPQEEENPFESDPGPTRTTAWAPSYEPVRLGIGQWATIARALRPSPSEPR
jgi:hypothetical protein